MATPTYGQNRYTQRAARPTYGPTGGPYNKPGGAQGRPISQFAPPRRKPKGLHALNVAGKQIDSARAPGAYGVDRQVRGSAIHQFLKANSVNLRALRGKDNFRKIRKRKVRKLAGKAAYSKLYGG